MGYADAYKDCEWVDFDVLESFMKQVLLKSGLPEADADTVTDVLIESDKRGIDSHGIGRLKPIYIDRLDAKTQKPVTKVDIIKETETTAVLDANNGMGHVVAKQAMQMAIDKAKKNGIAMVTVRNSTHYGIAGYYTSMATKAGMVGLTGTNARPSIAPTFGVENMLGTNPLTIGLPTDEEFDFNLDCATSVSQRGKLEVYGRAGKDLPEGWVIGSDGKTRTDTQQVLVDLTKGKAALAPLGGIGDLTAGFKGFGYSTVVEVLSAALQDGHFMKELNGVDENGKKKPILLGHFFIAINTEAFLGEDLFRKIAGTIMRNLRDSKKAPGEERIYTAGEKEYLAWQYRKDHGCPVPVVLQNQMTELRDRWNLDFKFSWDK
ncbi:MAG: lactate dehydrogenase [Spirochaetaceae bacterium 4572_59]|nr:MAG: lactate dehydrogenase [Spirochaetaceae bacterium 4572_59]